MADEKNKGNGSAETKQAVITPGDLANSARKLRIPGFRGGYRGIVFNDNGVSTEPVPKDIADELALQFPTLTIEEVADEPEKAEKAKK